MEYLQVVRRSMDAYNGFNLIAGTIDSLYYLSNRGGAIIPLPTGVVGLSNHLIDTSWPKVIAVKAAARRIIESGHSQDADQWFEILSDTSRPPDRDLPVTGVGLENERMLSPVFIRSDGYGTRSSALITVHVSGHVRFIEKTHGVGGAPESTAVQVWQLPDGLTGRPGPAP